MKKAIPYFLMLFSVIILSTPASFAWSDWDMYHPCHHSHYNGGGQGGFNNGFAGGMLGGVIGGMLGGAISQHNNQPQYQYYQYQYVQPQYQPQCFFVQDPYQLGTYHRICQ